MGDAEDVEEEDVWVPLFTAPPKVSGPRVTLFGIVVPGVATGVVEEAVWIAADIVER